MPEPLPPDRPRNRRLVDAWSLVHVVVTAALALVIGPVWAFLAALAYEPLEVLVLSPILARRGISFGHESLRNVLMDLAFDLIGAAIGWGILRLL